MKAEVADRVLFAPLYWLGNSEHHVDFPGTMSAAPRTYLDTLRDMAENFIRHGFGRIVFVNGHGGNIVPAQQATFELRQKYRERMDLLLLSVTYWTAGAEPLKDVPGLKQDHMGHACEWETSMILRLAPQLVIGDVKAVPDVPFGRAFEPRTGPGSCPTGACRATSAFPDTPRPTRARGCSSRSSTPSSRSWTGSSPGTAGSGTYDRGGGAVVEVVDVRGAPAGHHALYMDRLTLAVTATQLKTLIRLDDGRYGRLEEWFSYAFAFGGILFGFVADRVGPGRLYPVVLVGWSAAGLLTPLAVWPAVADGLGDPGDPGSGEFRWLLACRTLLGFFEVGPLALRLIAARNILSADDRPLGNSILQSGASLGAVLTPLVVEGFRLAVAPWQTPFVVIGVVGLLWAPLWGRLTRQSAVDARPEPAPDSAAGPPAHPLLVAFQFLLLAVIVITISLSWQFHRAWQPKYLKEHHGYSESEANLFASGYYLVADVGCLAFGAVVSVLNRWRIRSAAPAS